MLPAPASIAAVPSTKSSPSCNPAVPPPPVTGAAVGTKLVDEVSGAVTVSVTVAMGATVGEEVTAGVPEADVKAPEGVVSPPEAGAVIVPEIVTDGEKVGTVDVEEDALQAETATGARRVRAPQLRAVSLARRAAPAVVVRAFIEPLLMRPADDDGVSRSRRRKPGYRKGKKRDRSGRRPLRRRQVPENAGGHRGKAGGRRGRAMACLPSEY
jgi:hypothetical protein